MARPLGLRIALAAVVLVWLSGAGCVDDEGVPSVRPAWEQGQVFVLETHYRHAPMHSDRGAATADPATTPSIEEPVDTVDLSGDRWSDPVYWRYEVLQQGLEPTDGALAEYATGGGVTSTLAILRASIDPQLNPRSELLDLDPRSYLVVREDRLRLAALVTFQTRAGVRSAEAFTAEPELMNRSFSVLSQTRLSPAPTFIPPFPIAAQDKELVLEDGQVVRFANATASSVDVIYVDSLDGTLISETWQDGLPWASLSSTPSMTSRLLDASEVEELTDPAPRTEAEDDTWTDALADAVNLTALLDVDSLLGERTLQVAPGYRPWAGPRWPQSQGSLAQGVDALEGATISAVPNALIEPLAAEVQELGAALRDLRATGQGSSTEYIDGATFYRERQAALIDALRSYFDAVREGIDDGSITVADGSIQADGAWHDDYDGFDLPLDGLSPLDKFALVQQLEGRGDDHNPWMAPAWELLNHWSPGSTTDWGHSEGWSAAAILTLEPREPVSLAFGNGQVVELSTADRKGLLTEACTSVPARLYGSRHLGRAGDDLSDPSPAALVRLLTFEMEHRGAAVVFDTSPGAEVWNAPAWSASLTLVESTTDPGSDLLDINTAAAGQLELLDGLDAARAARIVTHRERNGPFQSVSELTDVGGINQRRLDRFTADVRVISTADRRSFDGTVQLRFTTDGVESDHVDDDPDDPDGFEQEWSFVLWSDPAGSLLDGAWEDNTDHPDFAWVPLANTADPGRTENPYVDWNDLVDILTEAEGRSPLRE